MKEKIQTVVGLLEPDQLGLTLTHEHLLHDLPKQVFKQPLPIVLTQSQVDPLAIHNLGWLRQYPYSFNENIEFADETVCKAVKDEMLFFKKNGGSTIVENGSIGLRTKDHAHFLTTVSKETGVHIIAGTGFYVSCSQSHAVLKMTIEEMEAKMCEDLTVGIDGTGVKCGVIGEVGSSWPMEDFERKSLVASASVQVEYECPVIIHPGRDKSSPEEILRIFQEAGGNVRKTVMSHLERTLHSKEEIAEFASLGSYCEFDLFGIEVSHYQPNDKIDMPSDSQRIERLLHLVQEGYSDRIVISHDIHTKHRLMKFGGHGYSHIIVNVVPKMLKRGFSSDNIKKILYTNPKNWLTYN